MPIFPRAPVTATQIHRAAKSATAESMRYKPKSMLAAYPPDASIHPKVCVTANEAQLATPPPANQASLIGDHCRLHEQGRVPNRPT
jgi:hypothetical protein